MAAAALAVVVAAGKEAGNRNAEREVVHLEPLVLLMPLMLMLRAGRPGVVSPSLVVPASIELPDAVVGGFGGGGVAVVAAASTAAVVATIPVVFVGRVAACATKVPPPRRACCCWCCCCCPPVASPLSLR